MRRDLLYNLVLAVAAPLVLVLAAESVARLLGFRWAPTPLLGAGTCMVRNGQLGIVLQPRCRGEVVGSPVTTNSVGLRSPELRDDGSRRVLAIGDSCTFGFRVADTETYPAVLDRRLQDLHDGRYQVLNAGVPGYTTYQGLVLLRARGLRWRPAVVIASFGFNDMVPTGDIAEQLRQLRRLRGFLGVDQWFLGHSRAYQAARYLGSRLTPADPRPRVSPRRYAQNLRKIVTLARAHGAVPILLSFWVGKPNAYAAVLPRLAAELAVPLVVYDGPRMDVVHPTAAGYEQLAGEIAAVVTRPGT